MTRSIEELTRIQHLWADAGSPHAGVLADALEHVRNNHEITPDELEVAMDAFWSVEGGNTEGVQAAITAFLEVRQKQPAPNNPPTTAS